MRRANLDECDNPLEFVGDQPASPTGRQFCKEPGQKVSKRTASRAKDVIKNSRARTPAGRRKALANAGLLNPKGQLVRTVRKPALTGSRKKAAKVAAQRFKKIGTAGGKSRTRGVLRKTRRQGAFGG